MTDHSLSTRRYFQIPVLILLNWLTYITPIFPQNAAVDEEVYSKITATGYVRVLVKLRKQDLAITNLSAKMQSIKSIQEAVLSQLSSDEFKVRYSYKTFPGLAGDLSESGLSLMELSPLVEKIELDGEGSGGMAQSVAAIQAPEVHNLGFTGKGVRVGVIDSGVNLQHVDLADAVVAQQSFLNGGTQGPNADDVFGHGSNVAGIITANGTVVGPGVAPDAEIVAIRVLDDQNRGYLSDWAAGVDWIVANNASLKVRIINMSLVSDRLFFGACDAQQSFFAAAANAAANAGIIIFASSGNTGDVDRMASPACLANVIAVGATYDSNLGREPDSGTYNSLFGGIWPFCFDETTSTQTLTCFTSRSSQLELVAPGAIIYSASSGGTTSTSFYRGTSQASPHVAGVAALMLEKNPALTVTEIVNILKSSASAMVNDPLTSRQYPLVNALAAVDQVVTDVNDSGVDGFTPSEFALFQNFPNPFNPATTIRFKLPEAAEVSIRIINTVGQEIRTLIDSTPYGPGNHIFQWDGKDNYGNPVSSGVYFYQLHTLKYRQTKKMILLR